MRKRMYNAKVDGANKKMQEINMRTLSIKNFLLHRIKINKLIFKKILEKIMQEIN